MSGLTRSRLTRRGALVDGILTEEHFATLAGLADFIEMVPR
jgi:hypothetical protein